MSQSPEDKQRAAVERIVASTHPKKIIVAGAGAGKTTVFKQLLTALSTTTPQARIAVTFINGLRDDLEKDLGKLAVVQSFHGYCHRLLRNDAKIRGSALSGRFHYYIKLGKLVIRDWVLIEGTAAPKFVPLLRNLRTGPHLTFRLDRGTYYDAVDYEDSIYRVQDALANNLALIPAYELVIVDEVQDFNLVEISLIELLAQKSPTVMAGDDDQALYGQLRGASEDHIRRLFADASCEPHNLPFCMRCTAVIVNAVNDLVARAQTAGLLGARIEKEYLPFAPVKGADDKKYPRIKVVKTSVQSRQPAAMNYFARYIEQQLQAIGQAEVDESHQKGFPTALIIAVNPHADAVRLYLEEKGFVVQAKDKSRADMDELSRDEGLAILKADQKANLGWRILLEIDQPEGYPEAIQASVTGVKLVDAITPRYRAEVLVEVSAWDEPVAQGAAAVALDTTKPTIRLTSFEGAKGLSAQHVFILGLQEGELPRNASAIKDLEVRRLIVALTRTRKQCHVLHSVRVAGKSKGPSTFLNWIGSSRKELVSVDKDYWKKS